jgi:hypothetical protein
VETVTIDARYRGPPGTANGGYTCGSVAQHIDGPAAEVSLRRPAPLDRPLAIERDDGRVLLLDGDTLIAEGNASDLDAVPPPLPTLDEARAAAERYARADVHPFPECFVCGPARHPPESLRLLLGPVEGREELFATAWTPDRSLGDAGGAVPPLIVWAALDCPTFSPVPLGRTAVLARLRARLEAPVEAGQPHIVSAWGIEHEGRKHLGGAAITTDDGRLCGISEGLWIELREA